MDNLKVIDRISFDILRQLANNARLSNKQVAAAVGLAPSTTHGRLKQLHSFGAYRGAHADVDLKKLGFGVEALMHIGLAKQKTKAVTSFLKKLQRLAVVRQFFIVTGRFDLIVHIAIRDTEHLKNLVYEFTVSPIIERIETSVLFESWSQHRLPEPAWLQDLEAPRPTRRNRRGAR